MQAVFYLSDVVITNFLQFFRVFLTVLGRLCAVGTEIAQNLSSSLYLVRKHDKQLQFRKYVVFKKCHRIYFYPFLTYCYLSLEVSIQSLLNQPNFFHLCEQWKQREVNCGMFKDVYDEKIWKKFMCYSGQPFLS